MKVHPDFPPSAIPRLHAATPLTLWVGPKKDLAVSRALCIALLQNRMILESDLNGGLDEHSLATSALSRWWQQLVIDLQIFDWVLEVRACNSGAHYRSLQNERLFCLGVKGPIPQFTLARRVEELESEHPGFGQTVVAVLEDAFQYLPHAYTPSRLLDTASWVFWSGCANERESWEAEREYSDCESLEQYMREHDVFTHAQYFKNIPAWLPRAKRQCERQELERAVSSPLGKSVMGACDEIARYVARRDFKKFADKKISWIDVESESVDASIILRWNDVDETTRTVDTAVNLAYEDDFTNSIAAHSREITADSLLAYMRAMNELIGLARRTEVLISAIGEVY